MNQTGNPLDQLRDIHLPEPLSPWPLAPGWWLITALLTLLIGYGIYRWIKRNASLKLLKPAQSELNQIKTLTPDNTAVAKLSALLKRVVLLYFPATEVASLSGKGWILFLNQQSKTALFDETAITIFNQTAYQANQTLNDEQWEQLISQAQKAINTIIRIGAATKSKQRTLGHV